MPPQLREIGFHVQNHATQWHGFQHEIQFQEIVVAWIQLTLSGGIHAGRNSSFVVGSFQNVFRYLLGCFMLSATLL